LARDDYEEAIADFREALELAEGMVGTESAQREIQEELRKAEVLLKRSKEKDYYSTPFLLHLNRRSNHISS
jgi:DnaJ family protein C protein 7